MGYTGIMYRYMTWPLSRLTVEPPSIFLPAPYQQPGLGSAPWHLKAKQHSSLNRRPKPGKAGERVRHQFPMVHNHCGACDICPNHPFWGRAGISLLLILYYQNVRRLWTYTDFAGPTSHFRITRRCMEERKQLIYRSGKFHGTIDFN